jgi:hypothetical protein
MLLLFGWVAPRLQHNVCQIVGNLACKTARRDSDKTGAEPASLRILFDDILAGCA